MKNERKGQSLTNMQGILLKKGIRLKEISIKMLNGRKLNIKTNNVFAHSNGGSIHHFFCKIGTRLDVIRLIEVSKFSKDGDFKPNLFLGAYGLDNMPADLEIIHKGYWDKYNTQRLLDVIENKGGK